MNDEIKKTSTQEVPFPKKDTFYKVKYTGEGVEEYSLKTGDTLLTTGANFTARGATKVVCRIKESDIWTIHFEPHELDHDDLAQFMPQYRSSSEHTQDDVEHSGEASVQALKQDLV